MHNMGLSDCPLGSGTEHGPLLDEEHTASDASVSMRSHDLGSSELVSGSNCNEFGSHESNSNKLCSHEPYSNQLGSHESNSNELSSRELVPGVLGSHESSSCSFEFGEHRTVPDEVYPESHDSVIVINDFERNSSVVVPLQANVHNRDPQYPIQYLQGYEASNQPVHVQQPSPRGEKMVSSQPGIEGENLSKICQNEIDPPLQQVTEPSVEKDLDPQPHVGCKEPAIQQPSLEGKRQLNEISLPLQEITESGHSIVKVLDANICEQPNGVILNYHDTPFEGFCIDRPIQSQHELDHLPSSSSRGYDDIDIIPIPRRTANQIQVQNTLKMARERIQQLVSPNDDDELMGNYLFDRFMARITNKELSYILHISALFLISMYKKAYNSKPWRSALKEIEGNFGSAVMLTFCFLRFVLLLNAVLTVLWMVVIVIPFFVDPPASFSWSQFFGTGFSNFFQGNGIEKSWIFYGGYHYTSEEQNGWYKTAYMYPCVIIASLLISWILILTRITKRLNVTNKILISSGTMTHPFCTAVFGSWDFGIKSMDAASRLRKGIRMRFREMLADVSTQEKQFLTPKTKSKRYKRYIALGVLWPLQIAGNVAIVIALVSQSDTVNKKLKTAYAQSILLTAVSMISPLSIPFLVKLEDWTPAKSEHIVLVKLFSLRLVNVCTLFARLYMALAQATYVRSGNQILSCKSHKACPEGFACCNVEGGNEWVFCTVDQGNVCMPGCMENAVAKQLLRLILTGTVVNIACDFFYGLIYKKLFHARRQLSIENLVIDIVYIESLVWVGSSFSPVAAFLGLFCNFITFSYMKFSLRQFYGPMKNPYSASRTSNLTHGLLLLALILCSLPASVTLVQKSSGVCGPIMKDSSMYQTLSSYIEQTPVVFRVIVQWIGNPVILVGVILLLVFGVILLREELVQNRLLFQARYNMFTTCCLLSLNDERQHEKIKRLSKQVSSIS